MLSIITYDKFFRITNCDNIIFFEDDFSFSKDKASLLYGFVRMNHIARKDFLIQVRNEDHELAEQLEQVNTLFEKHLTQIDWDREVIRDDITSAINLIRGNGFEEDADILNQIYLEINILGNKSLILLANQYGLGVEIPEYLQRVFNEFIFKNNEWIYFKIYEDFSANTSRMFKNDLEKSSKNKTSIACIIDNKLNTGDERANEIIQTIKAFNCDVRSNIIGAVLSSKTRKEEFAKEFFAEFVDKKDHENLQTNLQSALAKSAYSLILSKLKEIYSSTLESSFDDAIANRDIATYLSKMASYEGITNYKVVTDWIQLLFSYKISDNDEILEIVKLTQLIELFNDEKTTFSEEMLQLNTFEAFDYNVNKYFQPPAAGDVFVDSNGKYFILVGQDCDMMMSQSRNGNNAVTEFVKAEVVEQTSISKLANDLKYVSIDNFRSTKDGEVQRLQIDYSSREFIDNAVIKLCCFNQEGNCELDLEAPIENCVSDYLPDYLSNIHKDLQAYFKSIRQLNESLPKELNLILNSDMSPRLITLNNYRICENKINFGFKRVCRMNRTYVLYLYKLFLEYRGRHPFECINLTRHYSLQAQVIENEKIYLPFDIILSSNRNTNRGGIKKLDWIVKPKDIESIVRSLYSKEVGTKENKLIVVNKNPFVIECENNSKIEIVKKPHNQVSITLK
nr:hypothetical protein [uncultured Lachnoclostridium sp.]